MKIFFCATNDNDFDAVCDSNGIVLLHSFSE